MRRLVYVVGASVDGFIAGPAGEVGGHLAGALLEEIDELVVKLYPVVAGAGVPCSLLRSPRPRSR